MLTLTSPVETPLHRIPAAPKLAALCVFTILLFSLETPLTLGIAFAVIATVHLAFGATFARYALRLILPLWPFLVVIAVWHLWLDDLTGGTKVLLGLVTAVAAANLVTMTTRLSDMITTLERLAAPLSYFGLNARTLSLSVALVIRFIPVLSTRMSQITEAFRARSPRRPGYRILIPAALSALDDADHVAEALRSRGGAS